MKFIHCADVHLDSPLRGLAAYDEAPVDTIRGASRESFIRIIDLCLVKAVDFLLIAGDLYDGDWRDFNTGLFFGRQMTRLRAAGIPVFLIFGNHDALSQMTRSLHLPDNVRVFAADKPETVVIEHLNVAVHGQSFARRDVTDNLAASYPPAVSGLFNIGLLHTCLTGREGHDSYAPCDVEQLRSHGYDYWALGHIHQYEVVSEQPHVIFPGNIQGRNIRETGPKGCVLVSVGDDHSVTIDRHFTDIMRWSRIPVQASGCATPDEVLARIRLAVSDEMGQADGRPLAVRLVIEGQCGAHAALARDLEWWRSEVRAAVIDASGNNAWTEKIIVRTRSEIDFESIRERDDALGQLMQTIDHQLGDGDQFSDMVASILDEVIHGIPGDIRQDEGIQALLSGGRAACWTPGDDAAGLSGVVPGGSSGRSSEQTSLRHEIEQMLYSRLRESLA